MTSFVNKLWNVQEIVYNKQYVPFFLLKNKNDIYIGAKFKDFLLQFFSTHVIIYFSCRQVCKATNQFGEQSVEIRLHLNVYLSVHIHPQVQIINSGGTAIFTCSITGTGEEKIDWFHDGTLLLPDLPSNDK